MKRKTIWTLLTILVVTIFIAGCDKDDDENIFSIQFKANWNGSNFELNESYQNFSGYGVEVEEFKFYVSEINLIKSDGSSLLLSDIEYIDFKNGLTELSYEIDAEDYVSLSYELGVPVLLNGTTDPSFNAAMYAPEHPLSIDNGMYWAWAPGYKFLFFDGRFDMTPNDQSDLPDPFSFHTGKDYSRRVVEVNLTSIPLGTDDVEIVIEYDVSGFFNADVEVDLEDENFTHGGDQELAEKMMDNMVASSSHAID